MAVAATSLPSAGCATTDDPQRGTATDPATTVTTATGPTTLDLREANVVDVGVDGTAGASFTYAVIDLLS